MIQVVTSFGVALGSLARKAWTIALSIPLLGALLRRLQDTIPDADDQNLMSFVPVLRKYCSFDFTTFMRSHREALKRGQETGDFVPGVCNYYSLMADIITVSSGPFWHFVPMTEGRSRKECHDQFHHRMTEFLAAKPEDKILEFGCGFGEIGRQVALISGASVTGLTMADEEIVGGNERIKLAGLEGRCAMVQGNYHKMPFEDATFDKVFGVYTLKYSADLEKATAEMARVLKPGGRFVSYEILISDKYDADNKQHRYYVDNISSSTCMPPLWSAHAMRAAATKAGLKMSQEVDLCAAPKEGAWYSCFEKTGVHALLSSKLVLRLVGLAESLRILPKGFADFYDYCIVHPTTDFVNAGRLGVITGSVMMVWEKPC
jgi:ubiquinone/menaquinone biosynthesis C-methylase UbiE